MSPYALAPWDVQEMGEPSRTVGEPCSLAISKDDYDRSRPLPLLAL